MYIQESKFMRLNFKKTKEMILGSIQKNPPASRCVNGNVIDTVKCLKLLGINISDDLRWDAHVDALCAKVAIQAVFFKNLKAFWTPTKKFALLL